MLLITLALIALITVAVVAYFSRTITNRRIESASSGAVRADILARATAQIVVSDIKAEITGGSTTTQPAGQMPIYTPSSAQTVVPARVLTDGAMLTDGSFNSLVKQSGNRFFPAGYTTTPLITSSTSRATDVASSNNRVVSAARWNAPILNSGAGFAGSAQLPQWILMDRQGIAPSQSWGAGFRNYAAGNDRAVIGRFAYNVYDVGGLLDANVAGYPIFTTPLTNAQIQQLKSTQAGAHLYDASGAIIPGFDQARQTALVNTWRFGSEIASSFFLNFMSRTVPPSTTVGPTFADSGFMRPTVRDVTNVNANSNTIAYSRQDLLRLALASNGYLTAAALPYFTHFSRELNAPTWIPTTPVGSNIDYAAQAGQPTAVNRDSPNVRATTAFLRTDGTQASVGEPLIKNRFPLRRLDAIGNTGVNTAGFPVIVGGVLQPPSVTTVQRDFGLGWDGTNNRWNYVGTVGSTVQPSIATLNEIATATPGREPNFFELLKAFILSGSVGMGSGPGGTFAASEPRYQQPLSSDSQIIQIGANIIDQWDNDKNPTFIYFAANEFAGVENLPYLNKLIFQPQWTTTTPVTFGAWLMPSFWTPAQNGNNVGIQSATIPAIRFAMTAGTASGVVESSASSATSNVVTAVAGTPPSPSMQLVTTANFATTPNTPSSSSNPSSGVAPNAPNGKYGIPFVFTSTGAVTRTNTTRTYPVIDNATFEMQAQIGGATGPWKTYQKWPSCNINVSSVTSICQPTAGTAITGSSWYDPEYVLLDPRTMRFGVWETHASATGDTTDFQRGSNETLDRGTANGGFHVITAMGPQGLSFSGVSGNFSGTQMANNTSTSPNYTDLDGVRRQGDFLSTTTTTSAMLSTNSTDRSATLSRPIKTVAELGTVFRDQPWKTLNFTTADSGDAGLLDAFTIFEPNSLFRSDIVAGKLSLNTRHVPVLRAVLAGIATNANNSTPLITETQRNGIVDALLTLISTQPLLNKSELVTRFTADSTVTSLGNKEAREAVIRALSDIGQTRTWNLMIDVIAQVGRYSATATTVDEFIVQGEKRYWMHIAIDRFTGEVIDQQLEAVYE